MEDETFQALWKAARDMKAQNTVVFSGLELKKGNSVNNLGQIDFIVISLPQKSIIQIEVKKGNSNANRKGASTQLKRGQQFFKDNFPFPSSANWKYVKAMCFGDSVENNVCDKCKPFVFSAKFIASDLSSDPTIQSVSKEIANQVRSLMTASSPRKGSLLLIAIEKL